MALKVIGKGKFGAESDEELAQSVSVSETVTETTAKNKDGDIVGVALSEHTTEKTIEVLATDGEEPPAIGAAFEGGVVTARSKSSSNTDFSRWSVTVKTWAAISGETASGN